MPKMLKNTEQTKYIVEENSVLEQTSWIKVNSRCYTLIDEDCKVLAVVFTSYDEADNDENFIWDVEIEGEEFGSYVSLYCAKIAVQTAIAEWDAKIAAAASKKKLASKKKKVEKKSVARK
jgi:hypothetical protein